MRYRFLRFPEGRQKAATFSYDDGCRADIRLSQLFNKHGLKGTFNINSNYISAVDGDWHLTEAEIKEHILGKGHEVAVHGADHRANGLIRKVEGIQDVLKCRQELERRFDTIIRGMAYPDTGILLFHNETTIADVSAYLKSLDIVYARTLGSINSKYTLPADWYQWMPTAHHDDEEVMELVDKFVNYEKIGNYLSADLPKLFYLWGHAYEFNKNNNWERIEEICEKIGGKDDIWYATNIQIYEYVEAYNSLVFSADSSRIYNPTSTKVWFQADGKIYSVEPGETLKI